MDIKKECDELNINIMDICKLTPLGKLIEKVKIKNKIEEITKVLIMLHCNYIIAYNQEREYVNSDIHDKETQYNMLDHNAMILYEHDMNHVRLILNEVYKDIRYLSVIKSKKKLHKFTKKLFKFVECLQEFLDKYDKYDVNQHSIVQYSNDSYELEKKINDYVNYKNFISKHTI